MAGSRELRTAAWYGDLPLELEFPPHWTVVTRWPAPLPPLTDGQIAEALERPEGQLPIRELCRGKSRPLVVVDDLTRPTPASRVLPVVLRHLQDAGIPPERVRVLMATGTHGPPGRDAWSKKLGPETAGRCQLIVHEHEDPGVRVGTTSWGTRVIADREVVSSDVVLGIGGVFPSANLGFSGGSKLVLGVLGLKSIAQLHGGHPNVPAGRVDLGSSFRRDLDEIAAMIGLRTLITLHVDADRLPVRVACGDYRLYYEREIAFARQAAMVECDPDADVVVGNAFPSDVSLTIAVHKGASLLDDAPAGASRILVASCSEGLGFHGLFPLAAPRGRLWRRVGRALRVSPAEVRARLADRLSRRRERPPAPPEVAERPPRRHPLWVYRPGEHAEPLPEAIGDIRTSSSWRSILEAVSREQGSSRPLKATVYPCTPLLCLKPPPPKAPG